MSATFPLSAATPLSTGGRTSKAAPRFIAADLADRRTPPTARGEPRDGDASGNFGPATRPDIRGMSAQEAGAQLLFLPPYSPDFNPIEMAFSELKVLLRNAAERTVEGLWSAIGRLVDTVTQGECANFFAAAGYEPD